MDQDRYVGRNPLNCSLDDNSRKDALSLHLDCRSVSVRLVEPDDAFHCLECEQQFLSHDSWIDAAGPARRVAIPSANPLVVAYCSAQEVVDCPTCSAPSLQIDTVSW